MEEDNAPPSTRYLGIAVMMATVFVLETIVSLHSLWSVHPFPITVILFSPILSLLFPRSNDPNWGAHSIRFSLGLAFGSVLGEAISYYFLVVPWELTSQCIGQNLYHAGPTIILRSLCLVAFFPIYQSLHQLSKREEVINSRRQQGLFLARFKSIPRWWLDVAGILIGLLMVIPFGLASSRRPPFHVPYYERLAEQKAMEQLGADYRDYKFFLRDLQQTFREGQYVRVKADLIAYQPRIRGVEEVTVSWKEPWN